jgi:hypothetical protein
VKACCHWIASRSGGRGGPGRDRHARSWQPVAFPRGRAGGPGVRSARRK